MDRKECSGAAKMLERFQHLGELRRNITLYHGTVRADRSSFLTPLAVTEALLPPCQLSGDTDRIFPRERARERVLKQLI